MGHNIFFKKIFTLMAISIFFALKPVLLFASDPRNSAVYSPDSNNVFYFMVISDAHIGDDAEYENKLKWLLNTAPYIMKPSFIVNTGDLVNATKGGLPPFHGLDIQQKAEWITYNNIVKDLDPEKYYDLPGNHDRYGDTTWSDTSLVGLYDPVESTYYGYKVHSLQGAKSNPIGQFFWNFSLPNGDKYLFVSANTCDSTGVPFSNYNNGIFGVISDNPDLSELERKYIKDKLDKFGSDPNHKLAFIFGHAPIYRLTSVLDPLEYFLNEVGDTRGGPEFVDLLNQYYVSAYIFGHTHKDRDLYDLREHKNRKISSRLINASSSSEQGTFKLIAVDNNGISMRTLQITELPAVLITSPLDVEFAKLNDIYLNQSASYSYNLKPNSDNFVRAIALDPLGNKTKLEFRYKERDLLASWSNWEEMQNMADNIWQAKWDCSSFKPGEYELEVKATGMGDKENIHRIIVKMEGKGYAVLK